MMKIVYSCPFDLSPDKPMLATGAAGAIHRFLIDSLSKKLVREKGHELVLITPSGFPQLTKTDPKIRNVAFDMMASFAHELESCDVFLGVGCTSLLQIREVKKHQGVRRFGGKVATTWFNCHWSYTEKVLQREFDMLKLKGGEIFDPLLVWLAEREQSLSDRLIVTGAHCAKTYDLVPELAGKARSVGFGVDSTKFHPADKKPDGFNVLYAGGNWIRKGLFYLVRAWNELQLDDGTLTILSCNPEFTPKHRINVLGWVPDEEVPKIYQNNSVFVIPSLEDGGPSVTLEAMASGLPVIATEMGSGIGIEDGEDGFIVHERNADEIGAALLYFHDNPSEIERMGKNARAKALLWPWERFGVNVFQVLEEMATS
jgi:glycosyltransferase involved in cell wall biosynthesis